MTEYRKQSALTVVVAVIAVLAMAGTSVYLFPSGPTTSGISTRSGASTTSGSVITTGGTTSSASGTTVSYTTGIASTAAPCGSPGVYCGRPNITSASLTVNGSYSVLQVTLTEIGNSYIGSATVYVNGIVIGIPPTSEYEPPGNIPLNVTSAQPAVLVLTIPTSTVAVHAGMTYSVMVYCWLGPPGERASAGDQASINVKAG